MGPQLEQRKTSRLRELLTGISLTATLRWTQHFGQT